MGYVIGNLICDRVILEAPEDISRFHQHEMMVNRGESNSPGSV